MPSFSRTDAQQLPLSLSLQFFERRGRDVVFPPAFVLGNSNSDLNNNNNNNNDNIVSRNRS